MNCMALELPCAPIGHIFDMFSPRSLNTATGRPVRCKFTGVYVPSSSTPRLTSWSKNAAEEFTAELVPGASEKYAPLDTAAVDVLEDPPVTGEDDTVDLDTDSGHSSDTSVDDGTPDPGYIMPIASEAFETVMLELMDEEEAAKGIGGVPMEAENSMSDCSDDSFDFGVQTVFSESPTLDRAVPRVVESECSQFCCKEHSSEVSDSVVSEHSDSCASPRRVRFADHVRLSQRNRASTKSSRLKGGKAIKPILKSPSVFH